MQSKGLNCNCSGTMYWNYVPIYSCNRWNWQYFELAFLLCAHLALASRGGFVDSWREFGSLHLDFFHTAMFSDSFFSCFQLFLFVLDLENFVFRCSRGIERHYPGYCHATTRRTYECLSTYVSTRCYVFCFFLGIGMLDFGTSFPCSLATKPT